MKNYLNKLHCSSISNFLLCLFLFFSSFNSFSQVQQKLDSLRESYSESLSENQKITNLLNQVDLLLKTDLKEADSVTDVAIKLSSSLKNNEFLVKANNQKAEVLYERGDYHMSIKLAKSSMELAESISYLDGKSEALIWLGNANFMLRKYDNAQKYHLENIDLCTKINDLAGIASSYNNLGNINSRQGNYANAIEYYTKANTKYEALNDDYNAAITMSNIGMIHNFLKNYDKALHYLKISDAYFLENGYESLHIFAIENIAISYKNKKEFDKAIPYYNIALDYNIKIGNSYKQVLITYNYGNLFWDKGNMDSARIYFTKSAELAKSTKDTISICWAYTAIGGSYIEENQNKKAIRFLVKAKKLAKVSNDSFILMDINDYLKDAYASTGDFENAYKSFVLFKTIQDSLQGIDKMKLAEELEAKFQNEKKEKEIALLNSQNEINALQIDRRENERNYLIAITLAVIIVLFALLNQNKIKNKANKKLNELNRLQSSFFTNISHEFRTPLTLILAAIDQKSEEGNEIGRNNSIIQKNANRLLQLINQLLDLSKLEAKSERLQVTEVCVSEFVKNLASSFSSWAESKSIIFNLEISSSDIRGYIDTDKIQKIVYNLLSNSFKFTPNGGTVTIRSVISENQFSLEIFDNGIGMSQEALSNIFQKFYQVDSADNRGFEGSGIGLAITKELVELHKGNIFVSSEEKMGTSFMIIIPLKGYKQSEINVGTKKDQVTISELEKSVENNYSPSQVNKESLIGKQEFIIQLVEDNPDLLSYLKENLDTNYKIIDALNGKEGYEMALENIPDLIISDLMMPVMDGKEMSIKIRNNEKTSHIPIIMLTAKADSESKLEGLEIGADDYLTKPFDFKELKIKIRNVLLHRNRLHEHIKGQFFFPDPKLTANDKFIKKVSEIIEKNVSNAEFSINEFQEEMGYSRMQIHRKVKAITGHSASEFIRLTRLKKATVLLEKGYDQVSQIAFETGFNSPSYFSKCFKEVYGMSPKEYAAKNNKERVL